MLTGDVIRVRSLTARHHLKKGAGVASFNFSAGKKAEFILLVLDCVPDGSPVDAEALLEALGWKFVGESAAAAPRENRA